MGNGFWIFGCANLRTLQKWWESADPFESYEEYRKYYFLIKWQKCPQYWYIEKNPHFLSNFPPMLLYDQNASAPHGYTSESDTAPPPSGVGLLSRSIVLLWICRHVQPRLEFAVFLPQNQLFWTPKNGRALTRNFIDKHYVFVFFSCGYLIGVYKNVST